MTHDMDCAIVEELFSDLLLSPPWTPGSDCCMGQVGDDGRPLYGKTIYCDSDGRVKAINLGQGSHTPFQSDQSANQIIVGPIPPSLWQLDLTALYLDQNQFSGDISPLSNMTNLVEVDLSNNAFATTFPDLSGLTRLESLWMNHNTMAGSVPPSFLAPNLIEIDLSYNLFCGPLPQFRNEDTLEYCDFRYSGLCLTSPYIMMGCIQPLILCLGNTSCASPGPTGTGAAVQSSLPPSSSPIHTILPRPTENPIRDMGAWIGGMSLLSLFVVCTTIYVLFQCSKSRNFPRPRSLASIPPQDIARLPTDSLPYAAYVEPSFVIETYPSSDGEHPSASCQTSIISHIEPAQHSSGAESHG